MAMQIFYHGSPLLFDHFDLDNAGTGTGLKFGYGVYLSEVRASAEHYSHPRLLKNSNEQGATEHYLYTVEIPEITDYNHLVSALPVPDVISDKVEEKLGVIVPDNAKAKGKDFRKWVGKTVSGLDYKDNRFAAEKAAAEFLDSIGVMYNVWPQSQCKPEGPRNVAVFNSRNVHIVKVESIDVPVKKINDLHVAPFIKDHYPEYWGISSYPADKCAVIHKVDGEWGVFSNFYSTPIKVRNVIFGCVEELFVLMKFHDKDALQSLYGLRGQALKMKSKPWQKHCRRDDWGCMVVDAMKFCLDMKYNQCDEFRKALEASKGLYIVEQHANPRTKADAWSAKLDGGCWVGPNLLGRLLMELRDHGNLEYSLPDDVFDFIDIISSMSD